jgi:hypothetical protein
MRTARLMILSGLVLSGCASHLTPIPVESTESLAEKFRVCAGALGPSRALPILPRAEEQDFTGEVVSLAEPGLVSDGYYQLLVIDRTRTRAIIVQQGGIAGTRTVFGPFALSSGCAIAGNQLPANWSIDADPQHQEAASPRVFVVRSFSR